MASQAPWSPTAHTFAQHQFSHVSNFWKQGLSASFRLEALPGGHAELCLTFRLPSASHVIPPPFHVSQVGAPQRSTHPLFPKSCPSKLTPAADAKVEVRQVQVSCKKRKSYRRAVLHRAATSALSLPPARENTLRSLATAAVAAAAATASPCLPPATSAVKECLPLAPEGIKSFTSTSVPPCPNCGKEMGPLHQCDEVPLASSSGMPDPVSGQSKPALDSDNNCNWGNESKTEVEVLPLPLCHYCCHRGSDEHPVHFFTVCICRDDKCTCRCYCDEEQFLLKKQIFPSGLGSKRAVGPEGRALARATALASPWIDSKPCEASDCCIKCQYDTPCTKC